MANRRRIVAIALALGAVGAMAVTAYASVIDGSGAIQGCYSNRAYFGQHFLTLTDGACPTGTTAISWNQQGPKGDQGAKGDKGDTGATGATGLQGPQGQKGDTGAQGPNGKDGASVSSAAEPAGANCTYGGSSFTSTSGATYACNGAPGLQGPPGPAGSGKVLTNSYSIDPPGTYGLLLLTVPSVGLFEANCRVDGSYELGYARSMGQTTAWWSHAGGVGFAPSNTSTVPLAVGEATDDLFTLIASDGTHTSTVVIGAHPGSSTSPCIFFAQAVTP